MADRVKWTAIVLTCANTDSTHIFQQELELRQQKGHIDSDVILLTVEDPHTSLGSGGATINALLTVTEYISARKGYTVINHDVLEDSYILILHTGRIYPYDACGRAFMTLPVEYTTTEYDDLLSSIDLLIQTVTNKIAVKSGPGLWICSTEMLLAVPDEAEIPWTPCDVCAVTVPCSSQYCRDHGVYKVDDEGYVEDILYREKIERLECCERPDGKVPVVCSVVFFSHTVGHKLLSFYMKPPLDACTYMGVDSGESVLSLSLFFDVMLPMATDVNEQDFVSGKCDHGKTEMIGQSKILTKARSMLWKELHEFKIKTCMVEGGSYNYLSSSAVTHRNMLLDCPLVSKTSRLSWKSHVHSWIEDTCNVGENCCVINSVLEGQVGVGTKTIICHSHLGGALTIGRNCYIAGMHLTDIKEKKPLKIADDMIVQYFKINLKNLNMTRCVLTTHGHFDNIMMPAWKSTSTFCNSTWILMLNRTGILREDLWGTEVENDDQTILTARLFPVLHATEIVGLKEILWLQGMIEDEDGKILKRWRSSWRLSLKEILHLADFESEFHWRKQQFYKVSEHEIDVVLSKSLHKGFRSLYNSAFVDGFSKKLLNKLDEVTEKSQGFPGVTARALANIADILGCMAGRKGGLRSGPAANEQWHKGFTLLENGDIKGGVTAMAKERAHWMERPDLLVRAARHYEGAAQILIRQAVMTAKEFFKPQKVELPPIGKWIIAECPARIDVGGGWSDTPPITYEHGGAVTTVALLINGKKPVGAKVCRIEEPKLVLVICGNNDENIQIECQELSSLEDYYQPNSPGALLKAAFICADIVDMNSMKSLRQQLTEEYGGGFEIHSWSNLPHGSGLGTSSILAGAVMSAVLKAAGKSCDVNSLVHMVLYLEQLLTTGGGWQDQVGGLCGGIKMGLSEAKLPLTVENIDLKITEQTVQDFNDRLVLIYTGKTRLARNLLQEVVRNWYARNPEIVETENELVSLAQQCAHAFIDGKMQEIGKCMDRYWQMKKVMAPGCETMSITNIMTSIRPFAHGICMAGAGGGGFLYALAKDSDCKRLIIKLLNTFEGAEGAVVYEAAVDTEGLKMSIED